MAKYSVTSNLKHKGKIRAAGETIELDEETAAPLLEAGVVETPARAEKAAPSTKAQEEKTGK